MGFKSCFSGQNSFKEQTAIFVISCLGADPTAMNLEVQQNARVRAQKRQTKIEKEERGRRRRSGIGVGWGGVERDRERESLVFVLVPHDSHIE